MWVTNVRAWLHVQIQQHPTSKAVNWWFPYDGYAWGDMRLVVKNVFSVQCWCGVAKKVPCPLALFFSQLLAVFFLLFSLCGCTNSASANNYSLLRHGGRCIITADSLWILWRQTYNESSEDKRNNSSRVCYLSIFFNTSSVTAPLTGKPKTQIRCTVVRERIILCSNSVTPPRWINCCCFKCPHLTFAERLDPTRVSAPLRHNHLAHLWNGALIYFFLPEQETLH